MQPEQNFDATKPSLKKTTYLVLVVVLGLMIGFLLSLLAVLAFNLFYGPQAKAIFLVLIVAGAGGGVYVGPRWWQLVYVEHRHWHCRK